MWWGAVSAPCHTSWSGLVMCGGCVSRVTKTVAGGKPASTEEG